MAVNQSSQPFEDWLFVEEFLQGIESGRKLVFDKDNPIDIRIDKDSGKIS